ncbi:UPF0182 family membrane protein [Caldisericum exile]|uniref:UPF0182 protein CSE_14030 n=1 Tax=Caldisericum exile (strain DSM 21853 / NBRC 104410 / AZM16c01) TaxID=511051 RepID=A0A7U6JGC6_CALEA|nr:UPF0182 family protein [Caldisericum exile]BAL81529.1 hypothetical membrane protein [Caldisericum exile AZM16c01]
MVGFIVFILYFIFALPLIIKAYKLKTNTPPFHLVKREVFILVLGVIIVTIFLSSVNFITNLLWFKSVNYQNVFLRRIFVKITLFLIGFSISYLLYFVSFYVPKRHEELEVGERIINVSRFVVPLILAFFTGSATSAQFEQVLMFINRTPSNIFDPVFHRDVSFYLFTYPFLNGIVSTLLSIFVIAFLVEEIVYLMYIRPNFSKISRINLHATNLLSILAALILFSVSLKIYLSVYSLLFRKGGAVFGIGYTDFYVRIPIFRIIALLLFVAGLILIIYAIIPRFTARGPVFRILLISAIVVVVFYITVPNIFQALVVRPTELQREKSFLTYNINGTLQGFGLDKVNITEIKDLNPITKDLLSKNQTIVNNFRFWDWRALKDTYQQIQSIRLYYTFNDVDVDRYILNNELREVLVSARELDQGLLPETSKTWVNLHLKFTHGYGICMNTVNEFTQEGLPDLLVKDIPPISTVPELQVIRPEIYFGELTNDYIIVNTGTDEFDYPKGEENVYSKYKENRGIRLTPFNRFLYTISFNDINFIFSRYINSNSKLLYIRNIKDRVSKIAPYLKFDSDPYIVLGNNGKLYWVIDAYTVSNFYPYSEPVYVYNENVNYIRNSVKCVIDAYTGDVTFYIVDNSDPIAKTLSKAFPTLLHSFSEMPEFLKNHMRYPDDLMKIQGYVYLTYHMADPEVFYNKEDAWDIAKEKYYSQTQDVIPYFAIVKDSSGKYTFASLYAFTPLNKSNLVALMIADCSKDNFGKINLLRFPKDRLVYGPLQIEARIDQDSEISKVLTLWNQQGSEVIRGNLLVIPIDTSIIYFEPIYLQANTAKFPQIKKIVLSTQDKLVWGDTFEDSLNLLFGEVQNVPQTPQTQNIKELVDLAKTHFENYKKYVASGDYAKAGEELKAVEDLIQQIENLSKNP